MIARQCVLRENWYLYLSSSLVTINTVKAGLYKEDTKIKFNKGWNKAIKKNCHPVKYLLTVYSFKYEISFTYYPIFLFSGHELDIWDFSSLNRYWTPAPAAEVQSPNHETTGSPHIPIGNGICQHNCLFQIIKTVLLFRDVL